MLKKHLVKRNGIAFQRILYSLVACSIFFAATIEAPAESPPEKQTFVWWVAADTHVGHHSENYVGEHIEKAVADVNQLGIADYAIVLAGIGNPQGQTVFSIYSSTVSRVSDLAPVEGEVERVQYRSLVQCP